MSKADEIRQRIVQLATEGRTWEPVPKAYGLTVRHTVTEKTPDYARKPWRESAEPLWGQDTYNTHVFVTMIGRKVILGAASAPWMGRTDTDVPLWLAEMILDDPSLGLDSHRQVELRNQRKAAQS